MSRATANESPSPTPLVALTVAGALVAAWLSIPSPEELAFMRYKDGHDADAVGVYEQYIANGDHSAKVIVPLANIYLAQGEADRAVNLLERYEAESRSDVHAHELLAEAYRLAGRKEDYTNLLGTLTDTAPTPERLRELAALYGERGEPETQLAALQRLVNEYPGDARDRIQLAYLLVRRGDTADGGRALGTLRANELAGLDASIRTAYFQVLLATGRVDEAAEDLAGRAGDPATPEQSFIDLANHYLEAGRAAEGLRHLALLRALRPVPEVHAAWARLAAAAGHGNQVAAWLAEGESASPALLADLYHLGADSGQTSLALAAAERRFKADPGPEAHRQLALALLAAGQDAGALPHLRQLAPADEQFASLYRAALQRMGETGELAAYLQHDLNDGQAAEEQRRETAFELLALGRREAAAEQFLALAQTAPPDHPDVRELFYLWGPRPGGDALHWIARRAEGASGDERNAWLEHLIDSGGAAQVVDLVDREGGPSDPVAADLYLRALSETGDTERLATLVRIYVPGETDPDRLRRYAALAGQAGAGATAEAAYARLLAISPGDPGALLRMGMIALARQDYPAVVSYLEPYLKKTPPDFEAHYAYATALTHLGRDAEAADHYRATLALADTVPDRPGTRLATANSLDRLGRTEEAVAAFERLRRDYPGDQGILGEYAAMLYRNGLLDQLRQVTVTR